MLVQILCFMDKETEAAEEERLDRGHTVTWWLTHNQRSRLISLTEFCSVPTLLVCG